MTRAAAFKQQDIVRLIKGARVAGASISSIEIDPSGRILARIGAPADLPPPDNDNEWDEVLNLGKEKQPPAKRH